MTVKGKNKCVNVIGEIQGYVSHEGDIHAIIRTDKWDFIPVKIDTLSMYIPKEESLNVPPPPPS